jgi:pimeloyl-ACP methyl ester carboxylesterase
MVSASSSGEIRSGGRRLHVLRLGEGPRLIALHGGPGLDHHVLVPLATPLAERFTVWLPDLPGHGESPPSRGSRPGLWKTLDGLKRWLAGLQGGCDVLLGHSLGAWFVQEVLRSGTAAARAAVLISPLAGEREPAGGKPRPISGRPSVKRSAGPAELIRHVESEIAGAVPPSFLETVAAARIRPVSDYPELLDELREELERPMRTFDPGCPVLVVSGERDGATPPDAARRVARTIAGAEVRILGGAGHYPFVEPGSDVFEHIRAFVNRVA